MLKLTAPTALGAILLSLAPSTLAQVTCTTFSGSTVPHASTYCIPGSSPYAQPATIAQLSSTISYYCADSPGQCEGQPCYQISTEGAGINPGNAYYAIYHTPEGGITGAECGSAFGSIVSACEGLGEEWYEGTLLVQGKGNFTINTCLIS